MGNVTLNHACGILDVTPNTIQRLVNIGALKSTTQIIDKKDNRPIISTSSLFDYLERYQKYVQII